MSQHHERLLKAAKDAVSALFSDKSVSTTVTWESLVEVRDDIDSRIESLDGASRVD